jgi:linoleoyl-CoA desaturase
MGFLKSNKEAWMLAFKILIKKAMFYIIFLIIPLFVLPFSTWETVALFLTMVGIAGIVMTVIFQTAHVVPDADFIHQEEQTTKENWHVHQLKTTCNFASENQFITYLFGGLNFQIEHHLFPDVCHVHYPKIAKIVSATAKEFDMPYHSYQTFSEAVVKHYALLKALGKKN